MTYTFQGFYIPDRIMDGLEHYAFRHQPTGSFLTAVLENDLKEAVGLANAENIQNLPAYIGWLHNRAPMGCWGSKEKVAAWLDTGAAQTERDKVREIVGLPPSEAG